MRTTRIPHFGMPALAVMAFAAAGHAVAVGTPAGTVISNQATVDFEDANGNPLQALSNVVTTTVLQVASVDVSPDVAASADPGDVVYYAHTVTNLGNGDDTIDLTAVSSLGWSTAIYVDADGSGTFTAGDVLLGDTGGSADPDTGVLPADASLDILVAVTVPAGAANGIVDTTTVTGTSAYDVSVSESATDTTTITAPTLSAVKSVNPAGDQAPGTTLTYTVVVTNNGDADALNVVLTDPIPANTTYVTGSMTLNAGALTDGADADAGEFDGAQVIVDIGTLLAAGGSASITFQVTID